MLMSFSFSLPVRALCPSNELDGDYTFVTVHRKQYRVHGIMTTNGFRNFCKFESYLNSAHAGYSKLIE